MKKGQRSLTGQKKWENLCDSLADDVFDVPAEVDRQTVKRAAAVARKAIDEALQRQNPNPDGIPQEGWTKRTKEDGPQSKGPVK